MSTLGTCQQQRQVRAGAVERRLCGGELYMAGDEVRCIECGFVVKNHPLVVAAKANLAAKAAEVQKAADANANRPDKLDYRLSERENVVLLNRRVDGLAAQAEALRDLRKNDAAALAALGNDLAGLRAELDQLKSALKEQQPSGAAKEQPSPSPTQPAKVRK